MKRRGFWVLLMCTACGDVASAPDAPATVDSPPAVDAPATIDAPGPRCDPSKPFGTPALVDELNSTVDDLNPYLSPDELTITFASSRPGGLGGTDAYIATRTSPTGTFGTPVLIAGVNTAFGDSRPMITADGLTIYFETNTTGGAADWETSAATRSSTSAAFGAWTAVPQLNSATADTAPYVLPDHSAIYFVSNRGGAHELWRSARTGGNWATPALVTGTNLNDGSFDYPFLTPDELTIYFSSTRVGGAGARDLWVASRASVVTGFGDPVNVAALNTGSNESSGWVSADNCVIYFIRSGAAGSAGNWQIYRATKPL